MRQRGYPAQEVTKELPKVASGPATGGGVGRDVWDWLRSCLTCGNVHTFQKPHTHEGHHPETTCRCPGSWADPADGHYYRPRMNNSEVDRLQREYEEAAT